MVSPHNAKRFAGKPMKQPAYQYKDIEKCQRDLSGSCLYEVTNREHFIDAMGEIVLLCNEAMRRARHRQKKKSSKPLSLEYIADRLDVDDPLWGFMVRDKESRIQGVITCTTFTNWQKSFRFDSMHDSAVAYDHAELASQMVRGDRQFDHDGSLAAELQSTVRCGDAWNEGIVYPRIAEISLLGGLGCGRAMVSLVIEKLEFMKPTAKYNYDYVVLQATENSVPFYESMGFVRVGCVTEDDKFEEKQAKLSGSDTESDYEDEDGVPVAKPVKEKPEVPPSEIVSSPLTEYVVETAGESPGEIAKTLNVDVWDIIFLNHLIYKDLSTRSRLMEGTRLYIPAAEETKKHATSYVDSVADIYEESSAPHWYVAAENDTPKMIANKFGMSCSELVAGNIERLPELQSFSKLKEGTRIKVSHFHIHNDKHVPYCHWTFPDDAFEQSEPSYMMARKLDRRPKTERPSFAESSLAVKVEPYRPPPSSVYATVAAAKTAKKAPAARKAKTKKPPNEPVKPKRPVNGFMLFCGERRSSLLEEMPGSTVAEVTKELSSRWKELSEDDKAPYTAKFEESRIPYQKAKKKYEKELAVFYEAHPGLKHQPEIVDAKSAGTLFNKVVKLVPSPATEAYSEFEYFYVLTYIPDLQWCHLAPMRRVGHWGPDKPKCEGRPIWMLCDEGLGKEVDISASFCVPVSSRALKRTVDADKEQWDISESGPSLKFAAAASIQSGGPPEAPLAPIFANRGGKGGPFSAMKPLTGTIERKKKRGSSMSRQESVASYTSDAVVVAPLVKRKRGRPRKHPLPDTQEPVKKKRGRPRKNALSKRPRKNSVLEGHQSAGKKKRGRPRKYPIVEAQSPVASFQEKKVETPRLRGVYRELPARKAAPISFGAPSPSPKVGRPKKVETAQDKPAPRKRGRPKKAETIRSEPPKKRGRPKKAETIRSEPPKKRGRLKQVPVEDESRKKRGRPRKMKPEETYETLLQREATKPSVQASPRLRGVYRELPSRLAAPTSFSDPSPTPMKKQGKSRNALKAPVAFPAAESPARILPRRKAAPTSLHESGTPSPVRRPKSKESTMTPHFDTSCFSDLELELAHVISVTPRTATGGLNMPAIQVKASNQLRSLIDEKRSYVKKFASSPAHYLVASRNRKAFQMYLGYLSETASADPPSRPNRKAAPVFDRVAAVEARKARAKATGPSPLLLGRMGERVYRVKLIPKGYKK